MLIRKGLIREVMDHDERDARTIQLGSRELLNFASNDYLCLSRNEEVINAAQNALKKYGLGSEASRLLSGGTDLHGRIEAGLADLRGTGSALIFNSGYAANTGVIPALAAEGDVIFSDELNHASIIDGCRLSRAKKIIFGHCDTGELKNLLRSVPGGRKIVATESIFSMDGDIAPLKEIYGLCEEHGAVLYLDDAHGTGVLGNGKGALAHFGLTAAPFVIQMGTLSKALGAMGAYIASDHTTCKYILNTARTVIFSTALPPPVIAGAIAALQVLKRKPDIVKTLWEKVKMVHNGLESIGLDKGNSTTQIVPILCDSVDNAMEAAAYLFEQGVYAPAIRPPSVTRPRIRISITAAHTGDDIRMLLQLLEDCIGRK